MAAATSRAGWPPSVRVRIVMSGFIERLAAARIGGTFNFYRDGDRAALLRERLAALPRGAPRRPRSCSSPRRRAIAAPGSRAIPLTSERQLTGAGPAEATATIVHRTLDELGLAGDVLLWNVVPTHPGDDRSNRRPTRAEIEAGASVRPRARARAPGRRRRPDRPRRVRRHLRQAPLPRRRLRFRRGARSPGLTWYHRPPADVSSPFLR